MLSELESLISYNYTPAIGLLGEILLYGECGIKCIIYLVYIISWNLLG